MVVATRRRVYQPHIKKIVTIDQEVTLSCPGCKDMQTVTIHNGVMVHTRKFSQVLSGNIYHDCGSSEPCKVLSKVVTTMGLGRNWDG